MLDVDEIYIEPMKDLIIFTDLDGSLLDAESYTASPADTLFALLDSHGIPVIFNSSKTFPEMIKIRRLMDNHEPFVVENGSAVYVPLDHEIAATEGLESVHGYRRYVLGQERRQLQSFLRSMQAEFRFRSLTEMSEAECIGVTGLARTDVLMAQTREFSEPLLWHDNEDALNTLATKTAAAGFHLVMGGRFVHLMGSTDKNLAQRWLLNQMRLIHDKDFKVMALGDSENDAQMLADADYPVLIRSDKHGFPEIKTKASIYRTTRTGPSGWHEAVRRIFSHQLI